MRPRHRQPGPVAGRRGGLGVTASCVAACLIAIAPLLAGEEEPPPNPPQTAPQSQPVEGKSPPRLGQPSQTRRFGSRAEVMRQWLIDQGKDPDEVMRPRIRYEKGSFMITGSLEIANHLYDDSSLVAGWIEQVKRIWKPKIPLAAAIGTPGRVTFRIVITRKDGVLRVEKIEPSDLESFDEAASQAVEESKKLFSVPDDYPADWATLYLKFHYNLFSEI